jgi:hypothetical protein
LVYGPKLTSPYDREHRCLYFHVFDATSIPVIFAIFHGINVIQFIRVGALP